MVTEAAHSSSQVPNSADTAFPKVPLQWDEWKKVTRVWRRLSWGAWPCLISQLLLREGRPVQETPRHKHVPETHFPPTAREGWHSEETETRLLTWVNAPSWALLAWCLNPCHNEVRQAYCKSIAFQAISPWSEGLKDHTPQTDHNFHSTEVLHIRGCVQRAGS